MLSSCVMDEMKSTQPTAKRRKEDRRTVKRANHFGPPSLATSSETVAVSFPDTTKPSTRLHPQPPSIGCAAHTLQHAFLLISLLSSSSSDTSTTQLHPPPRPLLLRKLHRTDHMAASFHGFVPQGFTRLTSRAATTFATSRLLSSLPSQWCAATSLRPRPRSSSSRTKPGSRATDRSRKGSVYSGRSR